MSHTPRIKLGCALIVVPLLAGLTACGEGDHPLAATPYNAVEALSFGAADEEGAGVDPDRPLKISAEEAGTRITDVIATDASGRVLPGELAADGRSWHSTAPLAADATYSVRVSTENEDGAPGRGVHGFSTRKVSGTKRLDVTFGPEAGTYGVGQPVTAELSREVRGQRERALVESALTVTSQPAVVGSWHWVDDKKLHYRPKEYWPAHATISVRSALAGLPIREGLRGGAGAPLELTTGDRVEAVADISAHTMTVSRNGEELRTVPMTTGKEGFRTRNGKKVILGREAQVRMTGTSVGIPAGSAESYDLDVQWAARLTWSGEYVHGAPWSVGSHGSANVSHGCTGLSTENARWFFELIKPGDVVEHVNGFGEDMAPFGNGFGDWNLSWEEWQAGSALSQGSAVPAAGQGDAADQVGQHSPRPVSGRLQPVI